jgi:peptidoglycan/xylan/chitin deacetylase (PgdA/CDA1 family)
MIQGSLRHAMRLAAVAVVVALVSASAGFVYMDRSHVADVLAHTLPGSSLGATDEAMVRALHLRPASPTVQRTTNAVAQPEGYAPQDGSLSGRASLAPQVEAFQPAGASVSVNAPIVVTFSQQMARTDVEKAFRIAPVAGGRFSWPDGYTLRFDPYRLTQGVTYQVELHGHSLRGLALNGTRSWRFTTNAAPPDVIPPGAATVKVPILTYHYVRVNTDRNDRLGFALSVTPADFAAQMDWLDRAGYHTITTENLYQYLSGTRGLPSKPIILSFDDGYEDFFTTALPILRSHDFTAVAYIVSGFVGQPGYMTAAQITELDRSGIEIGSHTVSHANLSRLSIGNLRYQVIASKQALEQLIGHPVNSFCYPSGKYNGDVMAVVAAAGYHDATTTRFGYAHTMGDRYTWTRLRISGGEILSDYANAVATAS